MTISELPEPYKTYAEEYRDKCDDPMSDGDSDDVSEAFIWCQTPEGDLFWDGCDDARTPGELPPIPDEWKTNGDTILKFKRK